MAVTPWRIDGYGNKAAWAAWRSQDLPREPADLDELDDLIVVCNGTSHKL